MYQMINKHIYQLALELLGPCPSLVSVESFIFLKCVPFCWDTGRKYLNK